MKKRYVFIFIIIGIVWSYKSCYYRLDCDDSKNVKLGEIEFSEKFKEYNIERFVDNMSFKDSTDVLLLGRNTEINKKPKRYREYSVCQSINLDPRKAHAYYEYEDIGSQFRGSGIFLMIEPYVTKVNGKKGESIYITFGGGVGGGSMKARVPISNIDTTRAYKPYGQLYKYHKEVNLKGKIYKNIWLFRRYDKCLYYSKVLGVVALEERGKIYFRN